jgi:hypothetical protein
MKIKRKNLHNIIQEELNNIIRQQRKESLSLISEQNIVVGRWVDSHQKRGPGYVIKDVIRANGSRDVGWVDKVMPEDEMREIFGQDVKIYASYDDIPKEIRHKLENPSNID